MKEEIRKEEKFYFVYPYNPCEGGFLIVAGSSKEARKATCKKGLKESMLMTSKEAEKRYAIVQRVPGKIRKSGWIGKALTGR